MEIRTITDDEVEDFRAALMQTFGADLDSDPAGNERIKTLLDRSQQWAAFDGKTVVATAGSFNLVIGIPGGSLPIAGLTMVTVRPTHRRRGLLRQLITRHLDDARQRGHAVSGLWASEASIYGRFGYGIAAEHDHIEVHGANALDVRFAETDELEWIDEARAREILPDIYARATADRPGVLRRTAAWWQHRRFMETPWARNGASTRRTVVARRGDALVGYVVYRQRTQEGITPGGKTSIIELHAIDTRAHATLWRFVLAMDLFREVSWGIAPVDDPLPFLVDDGRRVERSRSDGLWLRIEDVPAALRARRYANDGVLRFTVDGSAYELAVEAGTASCAPTSRPAELDIDRTALGSLYLGGFAASRLARAQLVRGEPRAIAMADRLFTWPVAPWCPEVF